MAITYTQSQNIDPTKSTLGEKSSGVLELQKNLNKQNSGKAGYVPLKEDSMYGPLTEAATKFKPSSLIVNSNSAKMQGMKDSRDLSQFLGTGTINTGVANNTEKPEATDEYTTFLNEMSAGSDLASQRLISEIKASRQNQQNKLDSSYDSYKRGLQLLGIQHNETTFSPDLLAGRIQEAENEHQSKIKELRREETKALMDAQQAKLEGNFKILKEKMDYVRQIKKDQQDELKSFYDAINTNSKTGDIAAAEIFDTLQRIDVADQEEFLKLASQKYKIPIETLIRAISDEKKQRELDKIDIQNKKRIAGGGGSGGNEKITVQTASAQLKQGLKPISQGGVLGEDGYMDPNKWVQTRDQWLENKLPIETFNNLYKRYLNPKSYKLAGFQQSSRR